MKKEDNLPSRISVCKASIGISWAKCKQTIHEIASPCTLMLRMKRNTGGASGLRWNVLAASKPCKLNSIIQVFGVVPQSLPKWAIQQFISPVCRYPSVWSRSLSLCCLLNLQIDQRHTWLDWTPPSVMMPFDIEPTLCFAHRSYMLSPGLASHHLPWLFLIRKLPCIMGCDYLEWLGKQSSSSAHLHTEERNGERGGKEHQWP